MPVYRLGRSENGGFRSIHSPHPTPPSRIGTFLARALLASLAIGGCAAICLMLDA